MGLSSSPALSVSGLGFGPSVPVVRSVSVERALAERAVARPASRVSRVSRAGKRVAVRRVAVHQAVGKPSRAAKVARVGKSSQVAARRVAVSSSSRRVSAVLAYARAQVGKPYRWGSAGPRSFDCSGFTMRAYARAGLRLPHSSRGQAGRAYRVSWAQARPGDLVVGRGHVGIYAGRGMMFDAGNSRVDVVYRRVYRGLWIERLPGLR